LIRLTQFSRFPQVSDSKHWVLCPSSALTVSVGQRDHACLARTWTCVRQLIAEVGNSIGGGSDVAVSEPSQIAQSSSASSHPPHDHLVRSLLRPWPWLRYTVPGFIKPSPHRS